MRKGYFLVHRQFLEPDSFKNPTKTLAWIDFISMADHTSAIVTASYGFLASRWGVSKDTTYQWIRNWIAERQIERCTERSTERNAERYFVVNYAKYQMQAERTTERNSERNTERPTEQMKVNIEVNKEVNKEVKEGSNKPSGLSPEVEKLFEFYKTVSKRPKVVLTDKRKKAIAARLKEYAFDDIRRAWSAMAADDFLRGNNQGNKDYFELEYACRQDRLEHYLNHFITKIEHAA